MSQKKIYLTTTLPYVNADPHIGFALEIIQADVLARYYRKLGKEVFFNTGTDEHGKKIYDKAIANNKTPQEYVDEYASKFKKLKVKLNLSYNNFIRTTDKHHIEAVQEIWRRCRDNGYIVKKTYKAKYCVGCEMEKTDSELVNGKCPLHPNRELELIEEENYFFLFSKLEKKLLDWYQSHPNFVVPKHRQKEIVNFVKSGLRDFSISRVKEKMPWGIPVPDDDSQVMYVWFDALTNYISALGWPKNRVKFENFWGKMSSPQAIQLAGKDNLRQQSAMWQAILLSADLPLSKQIVIHGFITSNGQKMSKSLGNVVNPVEYVNQYGTDALRYYLLAKIHPFEDSDFTKEKFEDSYRADLQNGIGNLVARVTSMMEKHQASYQPYTDKVKLSKKVQDYLKKYRFDLAVGSIWERISKADQFISKNRVWEKVGDEKIRLLKDLRDQLIRIAIDLELFLPETANKILETLRKDKIKKGKNLFPKLEN